MDLHVHIKSRKKKKIFEVKLEGLRILKNQTHKKEPKEINIKKEMLKIVSIKNLGTAPGTIKR